MSQDLRKKIISLHKKGEGYKKISKALLISQNAVAKVVQTFKKDGTATISQRRPGRPRKLTPCQERLLMRRVEENLHASSLQLSKEVESQTGVTISRGTIRRTLQRNGMHGCRPRKKPLLKPRHKKARLEFARAHADKDEDYWDSILWSDETKINEPNPQLLPGRCNVGCPLLQVCVHLDGLNHISLIIILCIIVYVTNKAHHHLSFQLLLED